MRISDWSSDVCSSDLFDINADWVDYAAAGASGAEDITARLFEVLAVVELKGDVYRFGLTGSIDPAQRPEVAEAILRARAALIGRLQERGHDDLVEIGRASCRDRVCTYVSTAGVAVSLKK